MRIVVVVACVVAACTPDEHVPQVTIAADVTSLAITDSYALVVSEEGVPHEVGIAPLRPIDPMTNNEPALQVPFAKQVAVGKHHACALTSAQIVCWGNNTSHAVDPTGRCDDTDCNDAPLVVPLLVDARAIAAGDDVSCAITTDDQVVCWGDDSRGETGGSVPPEHGVTLPDGDPLLATTIRIAGDTVCAIDHDANAWCWGDGFAPTPQQMPLAGVVDIAVDARHGCAIDDSGLTCWGADLNGESGDAAYGRTCTSDCSIGPTPIAIDATQVAIGERHSCALSHGGDVWCWGDDEFGQLGRDDAYLTGSPEIARSGAVGLVAARASTCVLSALGEATCWGELGTQEDR